MALDSVPRKWLPTEDVTAALLNTELREPLTGIQAAWSAWTPTLVTWTLGNGTISGTYLQVGKTIRWRFKFVFGSTTVISSYFAVSLPVAVDNPSTPTAQTSTGFAVVKDVSSGNLHPGIVAIDGNSNMYPFNYNNGNLYIAGSPMTWATGDEISASGMYEAL